MDSQKLQTSQANALVYTTLVGFGFVGIYAGYRVKGKADFLSGLRTQSGEIKDKETIWQSADIEILLQPFLWLSIGSLQVSNPSRSSRDGVLSTTRATTLEMESDYGNVRSRHNLSWLHLLSVLSTGRKRKSREFGLRKFVGVY